MTPDARRLAERLAVEFRAMVTARLRAVVVFGAHAGDGPLTGHTDDPVRTLVVIDALGFEDLEAAARRVVGWARHGLATPLVIGSEEFARSLDAFPIEFGAILARHEVVFGPDPFTGLSVAAGDLRRACEVQVRSHLLHLREGYLEAGADPSAIQALVERSAAPLVALLVNLARIDGAPGTTPAALATYAMRAIGPAPALADVLAMAGGETPASDGARLYPAYLDAIERLAAYVDQWKEAS